MTVDLSEISQYTTRTGGKCRTGEILAGREGDLSVDDRARLKAAVSPDCELQFTAIARWLASKGIRIDGSALGRHKKGQCSCGR